jgi:hypothetical protein
MQVNRFIDTGDRSSTKSLLEHGRTVCIHQANFADFIKARAAAAFSEVALTETQIR